MICNIDKDPTVFYLSSKATLSTFKTINMEFTLTNSVKRLQ